MKTDTIADFISKDEEIKRLKTQLANMKANREREIKKAVTTCRDVSKKLVHIARQDRALDDAYSESAIARRHSSEGQ